MMKKEPYMAHIPTEPAWLLIGRSSDGHVVVFQRFFDRAEAENRISEFEAKGSILSFSIDPHDSIIPDRTLPTPGQIKALCRLLHHLLVQIRLLAYAENSKLVAELSDLSHNFPNEMFQEERWDWNLLEASFLGFESRNREHLFYSFAAKIREIRENR